jgi:hypothetical protein
MTRPQLFLISGRYRSGTVVDPARKAHNLALEELARTISQAGHSA